MSVLFLHFFLFLSLLDHLLKNSIQNLNTFLSKHCMAYFFHVNAIQCKKINRISISENKVASLFQTFHIPTTSVLFIFSDVKMGLPAIRLLRPVCTVCERRGLSSHLANNRLLLKVTDFKNDSVKKQYLTQGWQHPGVFFFEIKNNRIAGVTS